MSAAVERNTPGELEHVRRPPAVEERTAKGRQRFTEQSSVPRVEVVGILRARHRAVEGPVALSRVGDRPVQLHRHIAEDKPWLADRRKVIRPDDVIVAGLMAAGHEVPHAIELDRRRRARIDHAEGERDRRPVSVEVVLDRF